MLDSLPPFRREQDEAGGVNDADMEARDCVFVDNVALGSSGGGGAAIDQLHTGTTGKLVRCRFEGNQADKGGGVWNGNVTLLANCIFTGNTSAVEGAGLYDDAGANADGATLMDCLFSGNETTDGSGAGIFLNTGDLTVTNCTVGRNVANGTGANGGGLAVSSGTNSLTLKNSIVFENEVIHAINADTSLAIGSTFKLYLLGTIVEQGRP